MAKLSNEPLQPNPFLTYRDPDTGRWVVIKDVNINPQVKGVTPRDDRPLNFNISIIQS